MIAALDCSLALDLQSARADIDLQAVRFLLGLVEAVAEHAHRDDQRADDEEHDIAIAGHLKSPWERIFRAFYGRSGDSESDLKRLQIPGKV